MNTAVYPAPRTHRRPDQKLGLAWYMKHRWEFLGGGRSIEQSLDVLSEFLAPIVIEQLTLDKAVMDAKRVLETAPDKWRVKELKLDRTNTVTLVRGIKYDQGDGDAGWCRWVLITAPFVGKMEKTSLLAIVRMHVWDTDGYSASCPGRAYQNGAWVAKQTRTKALITQSGGLDI